MSIFHHDTRFVVELCETARDESDDPMIEIRRIKKQYRSSSIDILDGSLVLRLGRSFPRLVQVLEFSEKLISSSLARKEPAECCEWCIHTSGCIDPGSDLESDDISVAID